jgi:hypothetical protein
MMVVSRKCLFPTRLSAHFDSERRPSRTELRAGIADTLTVKTSAGKPPAAISQALFRIKHCLSQINRLPLDVGDDPA